MSQYDKALRAIDAWGGSGPAPKVDDETRLQVDALLDEYQSEIDDLEDRARHAEAFLAALPNNTRSVSNAD